MALHDFFVDCCMVDKTTVNDGFGSVTIEWVDGAEFSAGIVLNSSNEMQVAYQQGLKRTYTVVIDETVQLAREDRIKRLNDGLVLRITSEPGDMTTPAVSFLKYKQCTAEVVLP